MKNLLLVFFFLFLSLTGYSQCATGVKIDAPVTAICAGTPVRLTANVTGAASGSYTYAWSTGETTPYIDVNRAGSYTVTINSPGCPPITSKAVTTTTLVQPDRPGVSNPGSICPGSSATLTATGPNGGVFEWFDAQDGGTLLHTGKTFTVDSVNANKTYWVQVTLNACPSDRSGVQVRVITPPVVNSNSPVCAGGSVTFEANAGADSYAWYDNPAGTGLPLGTAPTFTTPVLTQNKSYYLIAVVNGCPTRRTVSARVLPQLTPPVITGTKTICAGNGAELHASADGVVKWYETRNSTIPLISSLDFSTKILTANTTFWVETTVGDCKSDRVPVTVTVIPVPTKPADQTITVCQGEVKTLVAGPGNYQWYDAIGRALTSNADGSYTTPALRRSTSYFVQASNGQCGSDRAEIKITVNNTPDNPSVTVPLICNGTPATLTATNPGGSYEWFTSSTATTPIARGDVFTTPQPLTATTTYYVQTTVNGCVSRRVAVRVTVLPAVGTPTANNATVCSGNGIRLIASGVDDAAFEWFDAPSGGNSLSTNASYNTPALNTTTTYYVQATVDGCTGPRKAVTVTVNPTPQLPTSSSSGTLVCYNNPADLQANSPDGGTITWYDSPTGGSPLHTGNNFHTPNLQQGTTYYAQNNSGTCNSTRLPVKVNVNPQYNTGFLYSSGTYDSTSPDPTPVKVNPAPGIFTAAPAGLVFVDNTTGKIDISATTPGSYIITYTYQGLCPGSYSAPIIINANPKPEFAYNGPYCQNQANPTPVFNLGTGPGVFSATPGGLVFVNVTTGQIDLRASTPGTYQVTNTVTLSDGSTKTFTQPVTINGVVDVNAGPDQIVKPGDIVRLSGTVSNSSGQRWSGGLGVFSNPTGKTTNYTPAPGETVATLTLTSNDPPGPCGPNADQVVIRINPIPPKPTVQDPGEICYNTSTILKATGPGGVYRWFSTIDGTTPLQEGAEFITPNLTATTKYYVQTSIGSITGERTEVTVTVKPVVAKPIVPAMVTICKGGQLEITATGSPTSYKWYNAPVGGVPISLDATLVVSNFNANDTYYVQTTVNGCTSERSRVDARVTAVPTITSASEAVVCSGKPLPYTITSIVSTATFKWSRAQVPGISNAPVIDQTSNTIDELLINTSAAAIDVIYTIVSTDNSCSAVPFEYTVTVYPTPILVSSDVNTVCNEKLNNYVITFNTPTIFSWSREAVPGIDNAAVNGQHSSTIREFLSNTTDAPIDVTYVLTYATANCEGGPSNVRMTVNPDVRITSATTGAICSGNALAYDITSNVSSASFSWTRTDVPGIDNPAATGISAKIEEALINTTNSPITVIYDITPIAFGCTGKTIQYRVTVNPVPAKPQANSNSPVCMGKDIILRTPNVRNGTFLWTGPNGFTSTDQNPADIKNATTANAGKYTLIVTTNGCSSEVGEVIVVVNAPPVPHAGNDALICPTDNEIQLNGTMEGGTTTGEWSTNGTGTFSPAFNVLNAKYIPSAQDKASGKVILTLTSTSTDDCAKATDQVEYAFGLRPASDAGADIETCIEDRSVRLHGKPGADFTGTSFTWTTTNGTGTFSSPNSLDGVYLPSDADRKGGAAIGLKLTANNPGTCFYASDETVIKFIPPPTVNAGGVRYVLEGKTITLNPTVSDENVTYLWTPNIGLSDNTIKNPILTGTGDRAYTLQITDSRGCPNTDVLSIKVSPDITIPNTFTPNGDGINDVWQIRGLIAYEDAIVDIFNRYGQPIFHSIGYPTPWDGTFSGKGLPAATYYYVIDTRSGGPKLTGYVTILR
ncbi:hypothetical protein GCM10023149_37970 [Mucilaginibacter gynuensis]|uniref:Gliding motility-associated-like protein n=1 Tax=Mucilaginibacter gynuensis TaxID=1302236 RepID=A0ABP8GYU1_9SPHI